MKLPDFWISSMLTETMQFNDRHSHSRQNCSGKEYIFRFSSSSRSNELIKEQRIVTVHLNWICHDREGYKKRRVVRFLKLLSLVLSEGSVFCKWGKCWAPWRDKKVSISLVDLVYKIQFRLQILSFHCFVSFCWQTQVPVDCWVIYVLGQGRWECTSAEREFGKEEGIRKKKITWWGFYWLNQ